MRPGDRIRVKENCNNPPIRDMKGELICLIGRQGSDNLWQIYLDEWGAWGDRRQSTAFESEFDVIPAGSEKAGAWKCECGSDKCGLPTHSQWCPKYVEVK